MTLPPRVAQASWIKTSTTGPNQVWRSRPGTDTIRLPQIWAALEVPAALTTLTLPFRDDFTSGIDAMWTELDTDGVLAAAGGRAVFAYPPTTDAWGNPGLVSQPIARSELGAFAGLVRLTNQADALEGFRVSLSPSATNSAAAGSGLVALMYPHLFAHDGDEPVSVRRQRSKDLLWAVFKREGGGWIVTVSEGAAGGEWPVFPQAAILSVTGTEADALVYAHLADRKGRVLADYAAIVEAAARPTALSTRFGAALASEASGTRPSPGGGVGTVQLYDCGVAPRVIEAMLTRTGGGRALLCFRGTSNSISGCWRFKLEETIVGLYNASGLETQTGAFGGGADDVPVHCKVVDTGTRIDCYMNGVRVLTTTNATGASNTWAGTGADTGTSDPVTVVDFGAWRDTTLTATYGPFPKVTSQVGASSFTDAFTDTNGVALTSHNAAWQHNLSTFEINTNRARITAAATRGIATVAVSDVNHGAKAVVGLPADPGTYPVDVGAGIVIRYTDNSNFIYGRLIWQDGPSPEIEVWEFVAGVANMVAYVNLTDVILTAGDFTLEVGAYGAEVVARLGGEVMAQGTTAVLTGTRCGIIAYDENASNVAGRPTWDDFEAFLTLSSYTATVMGSGRLAGAATSARSAVAVERAEARLVGVALKSSLAAATAQAKARLTGSGIKQAVFSVAEVRAQARAVGTAIKSSLASGTVEAIARLIAQVAAPAATSGAGMVRASGRLATAGVKAALNAASARAEARLVEQGASIRANAGTVDAIERMVGAGASGRAGAGATRATGRLSTTVASARAGATGAMRATGDLISSSIPFYIQSVAFRAVARLAGSGTSARAGQSVTRANARTATAGAKLGAGTATYRAGAVGATTGRRGGVGGASWRAVARVVGAGARAGVGAATIKALGLLMAPKDLDPVVKGGRVRVLSGLGERILVRGNGRARVTGSGARVKVD